MVSIGTDKMFAVTSVGASQVSKALLNPPASPSLADLSGKEKCRNTTNPHANPILLRVGTIRIMSSTAGVNIKAHIRDIFSN